MMGSVASPSSAGEALGMLRSAMGYLAAADASGDGGRGAGAVPAGPGAGQLDRHRRPGLDPGRRSPPGRDIRPTPTTAPGRGWSTGPASPGCRSGVHRVGRGGRPPIPEVEAALAAGEMSESCARTICGWTGKLPEDCREAADAILLTAAQAGVDLRDLAGLAAEIYARSLPEDPDKDRRSAFEDRSVQAGDHVRRRRSHDRRPDPGVRRGGRLRAGRALRPGRRGGHPQPGPAVSRRAARGHAAAGHRRAPAGAGRAAGESLGAYFPGGSDAAGRQLGACWRSGSAWVRALWAGRRAAASAAGSDGGAWLDGDAATAVACDAAMAPIVTGEVNPGRPGRTGPAVRPARPAPPPPLHTATAGTGAGDSDGAGTGGATGRVWPGHRPGMGGAGASGHWPGCGSAVGPRRAGVFLRRRQLGARLGGPSLPLDIGYSETIPASIRNAVILRDKHCQWAGRCNQPASACQVHHVKHKANGGKTSVRDCVLLCCFHHQVVIHRWGWTLVLNPDGTTTAWNKDKTKVLHSHGPPVRPG